jgi:hypothetical protein
VINGWKEFYGWKGLSMERSIDRDNVQIKARRIWKSLVNEDSRMIFNSNNIEPKRLIPKGPKAIFRPFLKFGQAIVKAIFIKNS